ncbi:MAG: hypothetical protein QME06_06630 [Desulfobacterales bacterium]|nr:hypothetical protein [Desulfobacterales bacterium]
MSIFQKNMRLTDEIRDVMRLRLFPDKDVSFCHSIEFCTKSFQSARTKAPVIDIISCLTGKKQKSFDATYFWNVARQRIRFSEALKTLSQDTTCDYNIIDVGPAGTYAGFTMQNKVLGKRSKIYRIMTPFGNEMRNLNIIQATIQPQIHTDERR